MQSADKLPGQSPSECLECPPGTALHAVKHTDFGFLLLIGSCCTIKSSKLALGQIQIRTCSSWSLLWISKASGYVWKKLNNLSVFNFAKYLLISDKTWYCLSFMIYYRRQTITNKESYKPPTYFSEKWMLILLCSFNSWVVISVFLSIKKSAGCHCKLWADSDINAGFFSVKWMFSEYLPQDYITKSEIKSQCKSWFLFSLFFFFSKEKGLKKSNSLFSK